MKEKNLFLGLIIASGASFALCGYSLITCFVFEGGEGELGSHILEISYLFMHLILCAIVFYLGFRAMKYGSFFIKNNVYSFDGYVYKKRRVVYIIFATLSLAVFVYSFIQCITMSLPLAVQLGKVVWHDLMNAFFMIFIILLTFILYSLVPYKHSNKHAEQQNNNE